MRARREGKARSNNYDQEVILEQPTSSITPTPCSLPGLRRKETITVTHAVDVFYLRSTSGFLQPDINKFPSAHNRGHGFRKFKTLQGCPNLAHHKLSRSTKDIPSSGKTRSDSESWLQDISTMVKQVQQHRLNVPTNPDRSCTYLVLRAHSDETSYE